MLALFTLGNSSNMFLLLRARELGLPEAQAPLAWAGVAATAMVFSTPISAWSDRIGRTRLLVAGWAAYGLLAGLLLLPASVIFGELHQHAGALPAFAFSAACALLAAGLLPLWASRGSRCA